VVSRDGKLLVEFEGFGEEGARGEGGRVAASDGV